jgi:hypothetical protein
MVEWHVHQQFNADAPRFKRFYHLFVEGEFAQLLEGAPQLRQVSERWEEGNWAVIVERIDRN